MPRSGSIKSNAARVTFMEGISSYFSEFCFNSTIHGHRYLGDRTRYLTERLIWLLTIIIIWHCCIFLILNQYNKWTRYPILVSFATTETPIRNIPFPAVTICPEVKMDPAFVNYTQLFYDKIYQNITPDNEFKFHSLNLICDRLRLTHDIAHINKEKFVTYEAVQFMFACFMQAYQNLPEMTQVTWRGKDAGEDSLKLTLTKEGPCMTFNMIDTREIFRDPQTYNLFTSINKKLHKNTATKAHKFTRRTFMTGISGGANFVLYINHSHIDWLCGDSLQGFKIALHHPLELPDLDRHVRLSLDQAVTIVIVPRIMTVAKEVKFYNPKVQHCYLSNQRPLRYFKKYTQNNCFRECRLNLTLKNCGCIPFYMPKDANVPICGIGSQQCVDESKIDTGSHDYVNTFSLSKSNNTCDCLPSCAFVEYDIRISHTYWSWRELYKVLKKISIPFPIRHLNYEKDYVSRLSVYYEEHQYLSMERYQRYSYVDLFANVGGLLGLGVGCSILSSFEIVYYLSLRWICNIKMYGDFSGKNSNVSSKNREQLS